jgi:hypothetical protein
MTKYANPDGFFYLGFREKIGFHISRFGRTKDSNMNKVFIISIVKNLLV